MFSPIRIGCSHVVNAFKSAERRSYLIKRTRITGSFYHTNDSKYSVQKNETNDKVQVDGDTTHKHKHKIGYHSRR